MDRIRIEAIDDMQDSHVQLFQEGKYLGLIGCDIVSDRWELYDHEALNGMWEGLQGIRGHIKARIEALPQGAVVADVKAAVRKAEREYKAANE